jgi:DNA-binding FadR family transcriptional regulator
MKRFSRPRAPSEPGRPPSDSTTGVGTNRPRVKALRLHGTIARKLGVSIVSGALPVGHLLAGEIASSEHFAVSRTVYREAVRILAAKGLVDARPKAGTRVNPRDRWHLLDPEVLDWMFELEPDPELLDSLFELRGIVESAAAGLAAARRSEAHLEAMREALEGIARHTLASAAGQRADMKFHEALLTATGNPYIISLTEGVSAAIRTTVRFKQRKGASTRDPLPDHLRVFEAIAARDSARAQSAMSELIKLAHIDTPRRGEPGSDQKRSGLKGGSS